MHLVLGDYSLFDLPPEIHYGGATLTVQQRLAFEYGVRSCTDARILLQALHVTKLKRSPLIFSHC